LKARQALTETSMMGDDIEQLGAFNGLTNCSLFYCLYTAALVLLNILNVKTLMIYIRSVTETCRFVNTSCVDTC